jgi:hypothetical protein
MMVMSVLLLVGCWAMVASAGESGHYPLGSEGIKAATLPPPGLYLKTYTTYYTSHLLTDGAGKNSGLGLDLDALAIAPRLLWMTNQKILGADYGMDILIPLVYTDFELNNVGVGDHEFCTGDMLLEPVDLGWHGDQWDIGAAVGLWFPTGKYDENHPASPGKDFWTTMFTLGGTYYFDQEKTWSSSILGRYEINSEKDETDVQPGQDVLFEWGLGKTLAKVWEVGVIGYCEWQLTDDHGSDVTWDRGVHDRVAGIGPEVGLAIPPANMFVSLRSAWEFSAVDRPEGTTVTLTVTKRF